jgi:hypothetical protein
MTHTAVFMNLLSFCFVDTPLFALLLIAAGIWPGKGFLGRRGSEMVASLMCLYGPKITLALALSDKVMALGLVLVTDTGTGYWYLVPNTGYKMKNKLSECDWC